MLTLAETISLIINPFDGIGADFATRLGVDTGAVFGLESRLGEVIAMPESARERRRGQYRSDALLDKLVAVRRPAERQPAVLGVAEQDIFVPGLNYVFGEADQSQGVAVISLARLMPEFYGEAPDRKLFEERARKEVVHELGHVFGLAHCENPACIMHFSNTITDTDRKGPGFCERCRAVLFGADVETS